MLGKAEISEPILNLLCPGVRGVKHSIKVLTITLKVERGRSPRAKDYSPVFL